MDLHFTLLVQSFIQSTTVLEILIILFSYLNNIAKKFFPADEKFVGGILILTVNDFRKLNGLSNKYWGWGLEDDEFYLRMKQGGVVVLRPTNITNQENCFR